MNPTISSVAKIPSIKAYDAKGTKALNPIPIIEVTIYIIQGATELVE